MENVTYKMQDNTLVFAFNGKISSENAAAVEEKVNAIVRSEPHQNVIEMQSSLSIFQARVFVLFFVSRRQSLH